MTAHYRLFDLLFQRHGKELLVFARQRAGYDNAEDLVQEAYARLLQLPDPALLDNPRAFLYQTAANLAVDLQRKASVRERVHCPAQVNDVELDTAADVGVLPEARLIQQQELRQLNAILLELPELTRYAFVLHRLEGLTHKEIARRLGISECGSERRIAKAARHILMRWDELDG